MYSAPSTPGVLYCTHSPACATTAWPALTSMAPFLCVTRNWPRRTTVYSSNSGVCPGSTQSAGAAHVSDAHARIPGIDPPDILVNELGLVSGGGDASWAWNELRHGPSLMQTIPVRQHLSGPVRDDKLITETPVSEALIAAARRLRTATARLTFQPPVTHVYNPLVYAWEGHAAYLARFGTTCRRVVFLGMNPGPFGMAQTGVPFGEVAIVRDWLRIECVVGKPGCEHPRRPVSGLDCVSLGSQRAAPVGAVCGTFRNARAVLRGASCPELLSPGVHGGQWVQSHAG